MYVVGAPLQIARVGAAAAASSSPSQPSSAHGRVKRSTVVPSASSSDPSQNDAPAYPPSAAGTTDPTVLPFITRSSTAPSTPRTAGEPTPPEVMVPSAETPKPTHAAPSAPLCVSAKVTPPSRAAHSS